MQNVEPARRQRIRILCLLIILVFALIYFLVSCPADPPQAMKNNELVREFESVIGISKHSQHVEDSLYLQSCVDSKIEPLSTSLKSDTTLSGLNRKVNLTRVEKERYGITHIAANISAPEIMVDKEIPEHYSDVLVLGTIISLPVDGCIARIRNQIYGESVSFAYLAYGVQQARLEALDSLDINAVAREYKLYLKCVESKGYTFDSPHDAVFLVENHLEHSNVLGRPFLANLELEVSLVDFSCREDSGLQAHIFQLAEDAMIDWIVGHPETVSLWYGHAKQVQKNLQGLGL